MRNHLFFNNTIVWIFLILCILSCKVAYCAFAFLADSYDKPNAFDPVSTFQIMPPKIIEGDYQLFQNTPVPEDSIANQLAVKAVKLASESAFSKKGYLLNNTMPEKIDSVIWNSVIAYSDASKPAKRKMNPYISKSIKPANDQVDAYIFFQIYSKFSSVLLTRRDVVTDQALNVAGVGAGLALTGSGLIMPGAYTEYDYKISIFDARSGGLIWFREGHDDRTDIASVGRFSASIEAVLMEHLPKCKKPLLQSRFKKKRSEIIHEQ